MSASEDNIKALNDRLVELQKQNAELIEKDANATTKIEKLEQENKQLVGLITKYVGEQDEAITKDIHAIDPDADLKDKSYPEKNALLAGLRKGLALANKGKTKPATQISKDENATSKSPEDDRLSTLEKMMNFVKAKN